jgi:hypothetical protein
MYATSNAAEASDFIVLARISERLIVAVSGAFSLWLGYKLFEAISQKQRRAIESAGSLAAQQIAPASESDARKSMLEAKLGDLLSIKMSDVGPGIFFALFGSVVLGYVMYSAVDLNISNTSPKSDQASQQAATTSNVGIKFANPEPGLRLGDKEKVLEFVKAIRTLETYQITANTTEAGQTKVAEALRSLSSSKGALIDLAFGSGNFTKYQLMKVKSPDELKKEPKEVQDFFYSIDGAINGGL